MCIRLSNKTDTSMSENILDKYIAMILSQRPDITRDSLLVLINEKSKIAKVSESYKMVWSIFMVAQDLGVNLEQVIAEPIIKIENLTPGLKNISMLGRVIWLNVEEVTGISTGEKISLCRMIIGDNTGWCYVLLWRDVVDSIKKQTIIIGDVVRLRKAYCKEGRQGIVELHIGNNGTIEKVEHIEGLPRIENFIVTVSDIKPTMVVVHVEGIVKSTSSIREFERSSDKKGYLRRFTLEGDNGSEISVSLWDNRALQINEDDVGRKIRLIGARVRIGPSGYTELAINSNGGLILLERVNEEKPIVKIVDIKPGVSDLVFEAKAIKVFPTTKVNLRELGERYVKEMILGDNTGNITILFWGSDDSIAKDINEGDIIMLNGVTSKSRGSEMYLQLGLSGSFNVIKEKNHPLEDVKFQTPKTTRINEINDGKRNIIVEGIVTSESYSTDIQLRNVVKPKATLSIADDTGTIQVITWGSDIQKINKLKLNKAVRITWCDAKLDNFSSELQLVISLKTQVDEI